MSVFSNHALRRPLWVLLAGAALLLLPAGGLVASTVVLHDTVNPNPSASVYFQYGLTTAYGNRTQSQELSGPSPVPVEASLSGLKGATVYHYRMVADRSGTQSFGSDQTVTTLPESPVAVTGNPLLGVNSGTLLKGSVNPNGLPVQVRFLYGTTPLYGTSTVMQSIPAGNGIVDISSAEISGLTVGATYHYRIIATTPAGTQHGADVSFVAPISGGGTGTPTGVPIVTTGAASSVTTKSAELSGTVNPNDGMTVAQFEYGMTTRYGHVTPLQNVGHGNTPVAVSLAALDLLAGTRYHFRLIALNSAGTSLPGDDAEFDTTVAAPTVVTGTANVLSTTSATVTGTVLARGMNTLVFIDYGTNRAFLSNSIAAAPPTAPVDVTTPVSATLTGLIQGTTYYYQIRAVNAGGTARGNVLTFDVGVLSRPDQWLPPPIAPLDRQGSVTMNLTPSGLGGWRFEGEWDWRAPGIPATGLTAGDRVIKYRSVPGYLPLSAQTVTVSGPILLEHAYAAAGVTGTGALTVMLQPAALAEESVPVASRAQWRFAGESDAQWKNSEFTVTGMPPGDYRIECKPVAGRTTPPPANASVAAGKTTLATMIYYLTENPVATPPGVLTFDLVSSLPYAFVGQITSDAGCATGFVVSSRVVATAGHVVFDDATLAATTGLRWFFQRHCGEHEPLAQIPRGYDLLSGYADQRMAENSPGTSTPESQNLDVAALYFLEDAGRGGYSGYLASDATENNFVISPTALKTLAGYPVDGIVPNDQGKMHATPPAIVEFSHATGQTYTTTQIRSSGGNSGGPLCVQNSGGVYYPAAIYLGGSSQMVVRAIDSAVVALFQAAEVIIYPVPVFSLQPVPNKTVPYGMQTTLTALANISLTANTTLLYQWYEGPVGDISSPVAGATSPTFTTPAITQNTQYWVRAISDSCGTHADSTATTLTLASSANANLSNLTLSQGVLSPSFNAHISTYGCDVPYSVSSITVKPERQVAQSSVSINNILILPGETSAPLDLSVGPNGISVWVTAGNGQTTRQYTITVTRSAAPVATTGAATDVTEDSATLHGSVIPYGTVSAYFEYQAPGATTYQVTPVQILSGDATAMPVVATVGGLSLIGTYHYHLVAVAGTAAFPSLPEQEFIIIKKPLVATGSPIVVGTTSSNVTLVGAVNPFGLQTEVYFIFKDDLMSTYVQTPGQIISGSATVDVSADVTSLINPNATHYYYRIVATNNTGSRAGDEVSFTLVNSGGGGPAPAVGTSDASDLTVLSATLNGQATPNGISTSAYFEYGLNASYGSTTHFEIGNMGNGSSMLSVTQSVTGLLPGTTYHFRCVAENGNGRSTGQDKSFTTPALPPLATTGTAEALTSTSAKVHATVRARGAPNTAGSETTVGFEYATNAGFTDVLTVTLETPVTGDVATPVSSVLAGLVEGTTYYYRVKATNSGGTADVVTKTLQPNSLMGFKQGFTSAVAANDYRGQVRVILEPSGGGWRFVGETQWRTSGETGAAVGLTTGDRMIEYQPLAGLIQPPSEMVGVVSSDPPAPVVLNRFYYDSAGAGDPGAGTSWIGNLRVLLQPDAAVANGAQWRLAGDSRTEWKNSGTDMTGILPGSYLVECTDVAGKTTPTPMQVTVRAGQTTTTTITYFTAMDTPNVYPQRVLVTVASTRQDLPYAYVGLLRSGTGGSYTGFVVKPQVVATVAQAVFDEATLTATSELQWLLQRNQALFEPVPLIPRGCYVLSGYAALRDTEQKAEGGAPGTLSNESLNLNVAALYFNQVAGRDGFSGFLAPAPGTSAPNEFLISSSMKTLAGYPLTGTEYAGQMHATPPAPAPFTQYGQMQIYTNASIQGVEGMLGGPLCVQNNGGTYYPAGIFVGGATGSAVRAIDSTTASLFASAETSAHGGANDTGGGITHSSFSTIGSPSDPGALKVTIEPAAARTAGAGWRLSPEVSYRSSEAQKNGLNGGNYVLQLKTVSGFQEPTQETVFITGGELREVTYTYLEDYTPLELWRLANFGTTSNTGDAEDSADPDGDGCPNSGEYAAATDPNNALEVFRILSTVKGGSSFTVTAPGKATRTYVLERANPTLGSGLWTDVASDGPLGSDGTVTLTDSSPPANSGFYRMRVTPP